MKKILLIDISNLFFRAFYAIPSHFTMSDGSQSNSIYGVISTTFSFLESERPTHLYFARDLRGPTFRDTEIAGYKAGRPDMPTALASQLPHIFDFVEHALGIPLLSKAGYEADDIIATVTEIFKSEPDSEILILSGDQDLLQLVEKNVFILSPQNGGKPAKRINAAGVIEKFGIPPGQIADYKALAGDNSDSLTGVPGIGPKGALQILNQFGSVEEAIAGIAEITGKAGELLKQYAEHALLTKRMALLCRDLDIAGFSEAAGRVPEQMPKNLIPFLEKISSKRLISRAKNLFGAHVTAPEQMGMF